MFKVRFVIMTLLLCLASVSTYAIDRNAYHVHKIFETPEDIASNNLGRTTYSPALVVPNGTPSETVVDEVYLRLEFKAGITPTTDMINMLSCTGLPVDSINIDNAQIKVAGQDLIFSYAFVDRDDEVLVNDIGNCWDITVTGFDPLMELEIYVTYHVGMHHNDAHPIMPNLYDYYNQFPGENNLFLSGQNYENGTCVGGPLLEDVQKRNLEEYEPEITVEEVIVFIHGWNPHGYLNHYAINGGSKINESWTQLCNALDSNNAVKKNWVITRYDWSNDASTGSVLIDFIDLNPVENANASRDAAVAHGLKLGRLLSFPNGDAGENIRELKKVHFIAHSAGNWLARRAAEYLRNQYKNKIAIQITSLDPFINDNEALASIEGIELLGPNDPDLQPNFELTRLWVDYLDNFYVKDLITDNIFQWTSGYFLGWDRNVYLETLSINEYYDSSVMNDHAGPILWYAQTANFPIATEVVANPNPVSAADYIRYQLTVSNQGIGALETIPALKIHSLVPDNLSYGDELTIPMTYCGSNNTCTAGERPEWNFNEIAPGDSRTVTVLGKVSSSPTSSSIRKVFSSFFLGWNDLAIADNKIQNNDLQLLLLADKDVINGEASESITYTLDYANQGDSSLNGVVLQAQLPKGLIFDSASDNGNDVVEPGKVEWTIGTVPFGDHGVRTLSVKVDDTLQDGDILLAQAEIQDNQGVEADAIAEVSTVVQASNPVMLEVTANPDPVKPGAQLEYTVTVSNQHVEKTLSNVTVITHVPTGLQYGDELTIPTTYCGSGGTCTAGERPRWNLGSLAPGEVRTIKIQAYVSSTLANGALLSKGFNVSYDNMVTSVNSSATVAVSNQTVLELTMIGNESVVSPGQLMTYTLDYGFEGDSSLNGVVLKAQLPKGVTFSSASDNGNYVIESGVVEWTVGTVPFGDHGVRTLTVKVDDTLQDGDILLAQAEIQDDQGVEADAIAEVSTVVQTSNPVMLEVTANPDAVKPGVQLEYTVTVSNQHVEQTLSNVTVITHVPTGLQYGDELTIPTTYCGSGGTCTAGERPRWNLGSLAPGEVRTIKIQANVSSTLANGALLSKGFNVSYDNMVTPVNSSATVAVSNQTVLELTMIGNESVVSPGQLMTYTLDYGFEGDSSLNGVVLKAQLPKGVTFNSASDNGNYVIESGVVEWTVGTVPFGDHGVRTLTVKVDDNLQDGDILLAQAEIQDDQGVEADAIAEVSTVVQTSNPVMLEVTANPDAVKPGVQLEYTVTVSNQHVEQTLSNVTVITHVPTGLQYGDELTIPTTYCGSGGTCTAGERPRWNLGSLAPGEVRTIKIQANVSSTLANGALLSKGFNVSYDNMVTPVNSSATVAVSNQTVLELTMIGNESVVSPGQLMTYTLDYGFEGDSSLNGVVLQAQLPKGVTFNSASDNGNYVIESGIVEWTIGTVPFGDHGVRTLTVKVDDTLQDGDILLAQAEIQDDQGVEADAITEVSTVVQALNPVMLEVTANPDPVKPGAQLEYTVIVSNQHVEQTLSNVTVITHVPTGLSYGDSITNPATECGYDSTCTAGERPGWNLGSLAPGEARTIKILAYVSSILKSGTLLSKGFNVSYDNMVAPLSISSTLAVSNQTVLELTMIGNESVVSPGQLLTYTLDYGFQGESSLNGVVLQAQLPKGVTFNSASDNGNYVIESGIVEWTIGTVPFGDHGVRTLTVKVDDTLQDGDILLAQAEIQDDQGVEADAIAEISTVVQASNPVMLEVTANPDPVKPGAQLEYTVIVSNQHVEQTLSNVTVITHVPMGLQYGDELTIPTTYCGSGGTCTAGERPRWNLGALAPGEVRTIKILANVSSTLANGALLSKGFNVSYENMVTPVYDQETVAIRDFVDTDGDGLADEDEINIYNSDPNKPDTDGDGINDYDEVMQFHTDPIKTDTDNDGLSDGVEVGVIGVDADPSTTTDPLNPDTDGDGLYDGNNGINPCEDCNNNGQTDAGETSPSIETQFISPDCTSVNLGIGLNIISHPIPPNDLTCFDLLNTIGFNNAASLQRFNIETGKFETCVFIEGDEIPSGDNYSILANEGYLLHMKRNLTITFPGCN